MELQPIKAEKRELRITHRGSCKKLNNLIALSTVFLKNIA